MLHQLFHKYKAIMRYYSLLSVALFVLLFTAEAQIATNKEALRKVGIFYSKKSIENSLTTDSLAKRFHWPIINTDKNGGFAKLVGVNRFNNPIYASTFNNIDAAATINTSALWTGGTTGVNLDGSSANMKNKLAIWDGGRVLDSHIELVGRINRMDSSKYDYYGGSFHATHVTGTMIAKGINPSVKGMCSGLQGILTYCFSLDGGYTFNDIPEASGVAKDVLISNHSYGTLCGWYQDGSGSWQFLGNINDGVDYNFGYYDDHTKSLDEIAYNAPYYLPVRAAGNSRNQNGPRVGNPYSYYNNGQLIYKDSLPSGVSRNDSYVTLAPEASGKNVVTVGAVYSVTYGYTQPSDVIMTPFSSWGPSNDGRIKPDLVADGVDVLSTVSTNDNAYEVDNGTSMASPAVAGSLLLLQEYYSKLHSGNFLRAATIKGLAIHTANEAGNANGPDYKFGWGLMNTQGAAEVIKVSTATNNASTSKHLILENNLNNGDTFTKTITATKGGTIKATISWTDPAGTVTTVDATHPPLSMLVNDLDMRITKNGTAYYPWVLNPYIPAADATTGDNKLDNIEQILIKNVKAGDVFTIKISHKGTLQSGSQAYSLIISQPGDTILPLKLLNFIANVKRENVQLLWITTNEVKTKRFEIETSTNGNKWNTIATINAKNATSTNSYAYNTIASAGINYYRLKMIDITGSFTFSTVQTVEVLSKTDLFTISPNPANSYAILSFDKTIKKAVINIVNASGKTIYSNKVNLTSSNNFTLPVNQFCSGIYMVAVSANNAFETKKLVVGK